MGQVSTIGRIRKLAKSMGVEQLQVLTDSSAIWKSRYKVYGWAKAGRGYEMARCRVQVKKAASAEERMVVAALLHELGHVDQMRTRYLQRDRILKLYTQSAIRLGTHWEERMRVERDAWRRAVILGKRIGVEFDSEMRKFRAYALDTYDPSKAVW
jgi:hypothetical protein